MPRLQLHEGVVGADAIFACLGPALEIFSRFPRVEKADGTHVPLRTYLEQVCATLSKEAINKVFQGADASGFEGECPPVTAMWLWTLAAGGNGGENDEGRVDRSTGYSMEYDAARKISQGLGAHMEDMQHYVEGVPKATGRVFWRWQSGPSACLERPRRRLIPQSGRKKAQQADIFEELKEVEAESGWGITGAPKAGETVLDRIPPVHHSVRR